MNTQKATALLQEITQKFSEKTFPETCAKAFINVPGIPSSSWSLGNQLLMLFGGTADARGYNQWIKAHRYVKKGSKAIYILVPMIRKIKDKNDEDTEKTATIGFKTMPVFAYEDTK